MASHVPVTREYSTEHAQEQALENSTQSRAHSMTRHAYLYRSIYKNYRQGEGQRAGWGGSLLIRLGEACAA